MSSLLADRFDAGYRADAWNPSPMYKGGVWKAQIELPVANLTDTVFSIYARQEKSDETKLFDISYSSEIVDGLVVLDIIATSANTATVTSDDVHITAQFTDTSTSQVYVYVESVIPTGIKVL